MSNPTKIVLNRQSDLILDNALITNPQGIVLTDISGVSEAVASINTSTSTDISVETSSRVLGDESLAANISTEVSRAQSREEFILEDLNAQDEGLAAFISTETSRATTAEASILGVMWDDVYDPLETSISNETSSRIAADASLQNQIDFITNNADPAAIDSLVEVVVAFQSADGDLNGAITNLANAATTDLSAEISNRVAGDNSLETKFDDRHNSQQDFINNEISTEVSSRVAADASLETKFDNRHNSQQDFINNEISTEISVRLSKDESLETKFDNRHNSQQDFINNEISTEISTRLSKDESLETKFDNRHNSQQDFINNEISSEVSSRVAADASLETKFDNRHNSQQDFINNEISTEVSSRVAADASLQNQIDFITNNADPAAIDSLTEVVAAFQSADGDINNAITNLANAATTDLSTEVSRAQSAEASLDSAKLNLAGGTMSGVIDMGTNEISNVGAIRTDVVGNRAANAGFDFDGGNLNLGGISKITNLTGAPTNGGDVANKTYVDGLVSTEISTSVSDRVVADESLAATISSEIESLALTDESTIELNTADNTIRLKETVSAPDSGVRTFQGEVDVETVLKVAGVDVMATLSSEVSRAESAEASIAEELSSEVSYIMANTDLSSIDSFAEVVADLSSEVSRAESVEATKLDLAGGTMSGTLDMGTNSINNGGNANFAGVYVDNAGIDLLDSKTGNYINVYTQEFRMQGNGIVSGLANPTNGGDATNKLYVDSEVSTEVARAESAELSLATDFTNIYAKKVAVTETPNGSTTTFTLASSVREGSELVYLNGLSLDSEDYTATITNGLVVSVTFATAPSTGDKVKAYGVY